MYSSTSFAKCLLNISERSLKPLLNQSPIHKKQLLICFFYHQSLVSSILEFHIYSIITVYNFCKYFFIVEEESFFLLPFRVLSWDSINKRKAYKFTNMYYVTWEPLRRKQIPEEAIKSEYFYTRFDE